MEIDVGAALRAEWLEARFGGLAADRAGLTASGIVLGVDHAVNMGNAPRRAKFFGAKFFGAKVLAPSFYTTLSQPKWIG